MCSVCAVAIRRTTLLQPLMASADYTWDAVEQFQWCFAEVNASIVCACAPALKPFFARYLPGVLSHRFDSRSHDESFKKNETIFRSSLARSGGQTKSDTYEMEMRDDASEETTTTKQSGANDEVRLWGYTADEQGGRIQPGLH
jgi:hypothetical protein